ncbi:MAG: transposase [Kiritimatiellales bacterium]|nr:transposase [Kiritimatiellales bacterium]MCF7863933.1 transposase [Kiritimatiellales bacterium]
MEKEPADRKHLKRIPVWIPDDQCVFYFVTVCCHHRRRIFISNHSVRIALESLVKCADASDWNVWQACFMPDHVHLVISPKIEREQKLSRIMQRWKSSSKQRLNREGFDGGIWQKEFFDRLLRSNENLTDKWRYVEMNPVRAGLCEYPSDYPYLGTPMDILDRVQFL